MKIIYDLDKFFVTEIPLFKVHTSKINHNIMINSDIV